jgi:hypothetical protein
MNDKIRQALNTLIYEYDAAQVNKTFSDWLKEKMDLFTNEQSNDDE